MRAGLPLLIARLIVGLLSLGNLVGFLWFGQSVALLIAAGGGSVSWFSARPLTALAPVEKVSFYAGVTAALFGEGLGAVHYYRYLDIPGNDHAWELRAPFIFLILAIWWAMTYGSRYAFIEQQANDS